MRKPAILLFLIVSLISCNNSDQDFNASAYVDPFIGSVHGRWFFFTPAARPFGMAKLAPHTNAYGSIGSWMPCGYDYRHNSIEGFGHFHEFQVGGLVFMPTTGQLKTLPGSLEEPDSGYRSRYSKEEQAARPGYYSVRLSDYNIFAELTATDRVGYQRFTFPESESSNIIIDIGHKQGESSDVTEAYIKKVSEREIEGYIITNPEYIKFCDPGNRVPMYFVTRLSKTPAGWGTFVNDSISPMADESRGTGNGMYLTFETTEDEQVIVKTGLSYTSIENARLNLETESQGMDFDMVRDDSYAAWNSMLGRIKAEGGEEKDLVKFYTGLYHALLGRGLASDVNGAYPMNGDGIGQIALDRNGIPEYNHYNTDGIWGGFWNLGQVWALAYPEFLSEYMQSNLDFAEETGWLHDGVASGAYANGVQTNYNGLMLAATYNAGIRDFDIDQAYDAAFKNETGYQNRDFGSGKYDLHYLIKLGYIPSYDTTLSNGWVFNFGASHTLEFCFSSYAVAQFARSLGKESDYDLLMKQSRGYLNLFDPETKFIRPKYKNGNFIENFDPMEAWRGFQEGNAFQYTWYVPHDIPGLIELVGEELFNERLEMMFTEARKSLFGGGEEIDSFSGLEKLYNHGNQPCLHNPWLFNISGKPWLTQKWTRTICNEFYGDEPLHGYGFGQDEDQGQLGAWYVLAGIGLFDISGHADSAPRFQVGSPLFDNIEIELNRDYYTGKKLVIKTINNSPDNIYVRKIMVNGIEVNEFSLDRNTLVKGAEIVLFMGPEPATR